MDVRVAARETVAKSDISFRQSRFRQNSMGQGIDHAGWMLGQIEGGEVTGEKAHRWLGYAQALLVAGDWVTLEAIKDINHAA